MLLNELQGLLSTLNDAETGQRGYLLVGDESYLRPYQAAAKVADQQIDRVATLMNALPGQRTAFDALRRLAVMKLAELKQTIRLRQSQGMEAAMQVVRTGTGNGTMEEIRGLANQIKQEIRDRMAFQDRQTVELSKRATMGGIFGSLLAAFLFLSVIQRERGNARGSKNGPGPSKRPANWLVPWKLRHPSYIVQSDKEIEALVQRAKELASSVEASRIQTLNQSDGKIEALGQQARELASFVEAARVQTLQQSDKEIKALGQQARELATSVETSRIRTLRQSDKEIESLERVARDLATSVETSRVQTLKQSEGRIEALGKVAGPGSLRGNLAHPDPDAVRWQNRGHGGTS